MVCLYCSHKTDVSNSRLQKRSNTVWRRRACGHCGALFSTIEQPDYEHSLAVQVATSHIVPFYRDQLFISIYNACRHRPIAAADAAALTATVISKLFASQLVTAGLVRAADIRATTSSTLVAFDHVAAVQYDAFHPTPREQK